MNRPRFRPTPARHDRAADPAAKARRLFAEASRLRTARDGLLRAGPSASLTACVAALRDTEDRAARAATAAKAHAARNRQSPGTVAVAPDAVAAPVSEPTVSATAARRAARLAGAYVAGARG